MRKKIKIFLFVLIMIITLTFITLSTYNYLQTDFVDQVTNEFTN